MPRGGIATIEALAVNLAMAGGRPERLPVPIATIEAMCDPLYVLTRANSTAQANLPGRNIVAVAIKGVVKAAATARIRVEPRKVYLENIQEGEIFSRRFQVTNTGQLPLVIKKIYFPRDNGVKLVNQPPGLTVVPEQAVPLELTFRLQSKKPITEIFCFDTNAQNAREGQYSVMLIVQDAEPR